RSLRVCSPTPPRRSCSDRRRTSWGRPRSSSGSRPLSVASAATPSAAVLFGRSAPTQPSCSTTLRRVSTRCATRTSRCEQGSTCRSRSVRYDREELLARTALAVLADELLGFHVGNGRNARWPSPVPNHPQTGRTPPMSIFVDHRGIERWTCFATGANGTAIDLVMVVTGRSVGDAIGWLAERARLDLPPPERPPPIRREPPSAPVRQPSASLKEHVEVCERILW